MKQRVVVAKFVGSDKCYDFYDGVGLVVGHMYMIKSNKGDYANPILVVDMKDDSMYATVTITDARRLVTVDSVLKKRNYGAIRNLDKILFSNGRTVVLWRDGTKTIVNCQEGDRFSKETGIALAFMKKFCGNDSSFNEVLQEYAYHNEDGQLEVEDQNHQYQL